MRFKIVVFIICLFKAACVFSLAPESTPAASDLVSHTEKRHFQEQNRQRGRVRGYKRFILIQRATSAQIEKNEEDQGYTLTLFEIEPTVAFYKVVPNRSFGILTLKKYMWYSSIGKSMFSKDNLRGCLGVLSVKKGNDFERRVFEVKKPIYDKKCGILIYQICEIEDFKLDTGVWESAILTLDLTVN